MNVYFLLGQVCGRLAAAVPDIDTPKNFKLGCERPLAGFSRYLLLARRKGIPQSAEEYIMLRIDDIDIDAVEEIAGLENQGRWQLGFNAGKKLKPAKELIKRTGVSQKELAERLGVTEVTVSRWCSGGAINAETYYAIEKLVHDE